MLKVQTAEPAHSVLCIATLRCAISTNAHYCNGHDR